VEEIRKQIGRLIVQREFITIDKLFWEVGGNLTKEVFLTLCEQVIKTNKLFTVEVFDAINNVKTTLICSPKYYVV